MFFRLSYLKYVQMNKHSLFHSPQRLLEMLFAFAVAVIVGAFFLDRPVEQFVLAANHGHWSQSPLAAAASRYGDWPELMVCAVLCWLVAWKLCNVRWQRILLLAMIASTLAGALVNVSRLTTGRTRPRAHAEQGWYGPYHEGKWLIGRADFNSFPSGHTATAVGFAGVILFAAPAWGIPAMMVALAIALSRIILGAHHPSDVVTASVVSLSIAWSVWKFFGKRGDQSTHVSDE